MITAQDTTLLRDASNIIAERMGLHFPEARWPDLARGLTAAASELGFKSPKGCVRWLGTGKLMAGQIDTLASHLTVGETYFLREPASFAALEERILPPLVARRFTRNRTLRLWSAGCCTGEEAYSLAITCARGLPDLQTWNVSILATDINQNFIAKGEVGLYSNWSFRGAPGWFRERFFTPAPEGQLSINPIVKDLVHFGHLNLVEDVYPSLHNHTNAMDVIFCRNVLMYFAPEQQRRVVGAMYRCLVDGGYLVVGAAEASASLFPMLAMEYIGGAILCHKTSQATGVESHRGIVSPFLPPAAPVPERATIAPPVPPVPLGPVAPALQITPSASPPREDPLALARTFANQGRLEEALTWSQDAITAERTNAAAHFLYATICHELGQLEEEAAALRKVIYLDQHFILAHCALADLHRRLGKQKESRRHLAVAHELLSTRSRDEIVPESDGMTCGWLAESVRAMMGA